VATPNPLDHPIVLARPRRLSEITSWQHHIPFGMWLVDVLRPQLVVELGTHFGDSYCAFCQAVDELGLPAACFAVDTWAGDEHAGFYGTEVLEDLRAHHNPLYSGFSELMHMTFDEALPRFHDASIDLLHIDGRHGYEDVRSDFESWLPKLSDKGVVLLHDTMRQLDGFGVYRLVAELRGRYPVFEFAHGSGLALVAVGDHAPGEILELTRLEGAALERWRDFFATLGAGVRLIGHVQRETPSARRIRADLDGVRAELEGVRAELEGVRAELVGVRAAFGEVAANPVLRLGELARRLRLRSRG